MRSLHDDQVDDEWKSCLLSPSLSPPIYDFQRWAGAAPDFNGSRLPSFVFRLQRGELPPTPFPLQFPHCSLLSPTFPLSLSGTRFFSSSSSSSSSSPSASSADICPSALNFHRDLTRGPNYCARCLRLPPSSPLFLEPRSTLY